MAGHLLHRRIGLSGHESLGEVGAHLAHRAEPEPDRDAVVRLRARFEGGTRGRAVDVGGVHDHPVTTGVLYQGVR